MNCSAIGNNPVNFNHRLDQTSFFTRPDRKGINGAGKADAMTDRLVDRDIISGNGGNDPLEILVKCMRPPGTSSPFDARRDHQS
jgi:hypothetical protein